jgi:hypothetical protein
MMHFRIIRVDHGLSHSTMLERERDEAGTDQAHGSIRTSAQCCCVMLV